MRPRKHILSLAILGALVTVICVAIFAPRITNFYPHIVIETPGELRLTFLQPARPRQAECESVTATITDAILASCGECRAVVRHCLSALDSEQKRLFSADVLGLPSARLPIGVVTFAAADPTIALGACQESARQASGGLRNAKVTCFPAGTVRELDTPPNRIFEKTQAGFIFLVMLLAGLASCFACYLIVRYDDLHAHLTHDHLGTGPQKFHAVPTPRIGGLTLLIGLLVAAAVLPATQQSLAAGEFGYLLLASLPAFAGGMTEDITKKVAVIPRLLLTMLSAAVAAWLLGAALKGLDLPGIDTLLRWTPFAIVFTVFAVSGVANAINIIDGYNGLAGGYAVIVLIALAWVAGQLGDTLLLTCTITMVGALLGFLVWNYPKGRVFLGDGGAYLLGFWIAEISVLLVIRHPEVSPWFPFLLLIYPVFETLFSIYRRRSLRKQSRSPGQPDALHLHQLIYTRLIRLGVGTKDPILMTRRNSMVATYIWIMSLLNVVPALVFWRHTWWLMIFSLGFCVWYLWIYRRIVRWQAPIWLTRVAE